MNTADASRPTGRRCCSLTRRMLPLLSAALLLAGCAPAPTAVRTDRPTIRIKGSDTMLLLVSRWAEEFMKLHPEVAIYNEGGGTETGIDALIDGSVELSAASRTLRADEARRLLQTRRSLGYSILTARDALSVYLNPGNPLRDLSMEQLRRLFTGEAGSWSEVGGEARTVQVIGRPPNSGTRQFFEEHVLRGAPYAASTITVPTTKAVIRMVMEDRGGIGYGGLAYGSDVIHASIDGVAPTAENVRSGAYPISRYLYLYAAEPPDGHVKEFIDWILSDAGQRIVREIGYIPLWDPAGE